MARLWLELPATIFMGGQPETREESAAPELLRIDEAHEFLGLRLNAWVSIGVFVLAVLGFVWSQRREQRERPKKSEPPPPPEGPTMAIPKGRVR